MYRVASGGVSRLEPGKHQLPLDVLQLVPPLADPLAAQLLGECAQGDVRLEGLHQEHAQRIPLVGNLHHNVVQAVGGHKLAFWWGQRGGGK